MDAYEETLQRIEKFAERLPLHIVGRTKGALLEEYVKKRKPKTILEVGALVGYSAILMARHMKGGKLTTIEIDRQNAMTARENAQRANLDHLIEVIEGDAIKILPAMTGTFDMIFLDGKKEEYIKYFKALEKNMKRRTIVIADNVKIFEQKMKDYLDYVRKNKKYFSFTKDFGDDAMEVSVKK